MLPPPGGDKNFFAGLPAPAHGAFWAAWLLTAPDGVWLQPAVWISQVGLLGAAMISQWPFLALKSRKKWPYWLTLALSGSAWVSLARISGIPSAIPIGLLVLYAITSRLAYTKH